MLKMIPLLILYFLKMCFLMIMLPLAIIYLAFVHIEVLYLIQINFLFESPLTFCNCLCSLAKTLFIFIVLQLI